MKERLVAIGEDVVLLFIFGGEEFEEGRKGRFYLQHEDSLDIASKEKV